MEKLKDLIENQRKGKENTAVFMVGEQLLGIAANEPESLEILKQDLLVPDMSIEKAEKKIKEYSDKNRNGASSFCVSPHIAEGILRKFYGLKEPSGATPEHTVVQAPGGDGYIDLDSFL